MADRNMETKFKQLIDALTQGISAGRIAERVKNTEVKYQYAGFELEVILTWLSGKDFDKIIDLLTIFHTRGTKISKMKKSIKDEYLAEFTELTKDILDNVKTDKKAITLSRISIAIPAVSFHVARNCSPSDMMRDFLGEYIKYFPLCINAIPALMAFDLGMSNDERTNMWNLNALANYYVSARSRTGNIKPTMNSTIGYMKLTFDNTKEFPKLAKSIKARYGEVSLWAELTDEIVNAIADRNNLTTELSQVTPPPSIRIRLTTNA